MSRPSKEPIQGQSSTCTTPTTGSTATTARSTTKPRRDWRERERSRSSPRISTRDAPKQPRAPPRPKRRPRTAYRFGSGVTTDRRQNAARPILLRPEVHSLPRALSPNRGPPPLPPVLESSRPALRSRTPPVGSSPPPPGRAPAHDLEVEGAPPRHRRRQDRHSGRGGEAVQRLPAARLPHGSSPRLRPERWLGPAPGISQRSLGRRRRHHG